MVHTGKRLNVVAFVIQLATTANIKQAGSQCCTAGDSVPFRGAKYCTMVVHSSQETMQNMEKFFGHHFWSLTRALAYMYVATS